VYKWLGKYQSFILKLYGRGTFRFVCPKLEKFFSYFPARIGLERITIPDVSAYRKWRIENGTKESTIDIELKCVSDFWKHLITFEGLPLYNPAAKTVPIKLCRNKYSLKLEDLRLLLSECHTEKLRAYVLSLVFDTPTNDIDSYEKHYGVAEAAQRAGLTWCTSTKVLRYAIVHSLWKNIIQSEYPKLLSYLAPEVSAVVEENPPPPEANVQSEPPPSQSNPQLRQEETQGVLGSTVLSSA
jgi:hypothetical protein